MGRRRNCGLDEVASWPWQLGLMADVFPFLLIRYGIGAWLSTAGGPLLAPLGQQFGGMIAPLAWIVMFACWIWPGRGTRRRTPTRTRTNATTGTGAFDSGRPHTLLPQLRRRNAAAP